MGHISLCSPGDKANGGKTTPSIWQSSNLTRIGEPQSERTWMFKWILSICINWNGLQLSNLVSIVDQLADCSVWYKSGMILKWAKLWSGGNVWNMSLLKNAHQECFSNIRRQALQGLRPGPLWAPLRQTSVLRRGKKIYGCLLTSMITERNSIQELYSLILFLY